jgi:acyl carrier protein
MSFHQKYGARWRGVAQRAFASSPRPYDLIGVICLKEFPLNASGKLTEKRCRRQERRAGRMPQAASELKRLFSEIFARVLGVDEVNADDDFFALGGHSLLAMQLAAELETEFKTPVSVGEVIVNSSVERLARALSRNKRAKSARRASAKCCIFARADAPLICIHPASGFRGVQRPYPLPRKRRPRDRTPVPAPKWSHRGLRLDG